MAAEIADRPEDGKDSSSATWKFDFEDTVNADPLAKGACLKVVRCYLNYCSKSDPKAFCSIPELMLRCGCSRPAVLRAKALLERLGYLVALYVTEEGATMYRLVNARKALIDDHLRIARESMAASKRDRKRTERKRAKHAGSNETIPPENDNVERNDTPVCNETIPNTVEVHRRDSSYEEGSNWKGTQDDAEDTSPENLYAHVADGDDRHQTLPIPDDDDEADRMMDEICMGRSVSDTIRGHMTRMLFDGTLSLSLIDRLTLPKNEEAAA